MAGCFLWVFKSNSGSQRPFLRGNLYKISYKEQLQMLYDYLSRHLISTSVLQSF